MSDTIKHLLKAAVAAGFLAAATAALANAELNKAAPAFDALGADGKPLKLDGYKGKTVVLEWTNHECPFVAKHYDSGNIPNLQKDAAGKGVVWLQVLSSAPGKQGHVDGATAQKLNGSRKAAPTATVLDPDGKIGKLYGAQTTPHIFIVNAAGQLVYKGGIDSIPTADKNDLPKAENYVSAALAAISAGKPVEKANTRPYGCSIKYAG
ncbi:redoxin domain-containing protein [Massilia atriviolacea]|uniref:Redoxin domain-containing protein n=1 Tax=Massilia atriviolacea TaxID=2495579 RepID=A0A430HTH6_9BURK|nr:redoxin family protein [Massilia atriviolacea]RSZ60841.1 redoxin domain-containing protein [Massilia atriviolacea]